MKLDREKLIRSRELLGYGIETTAEVAGVSKNSVLRAEHEEDIRPVTARKIATALGVEVRDLFPLDQPLLSREWALSTPDEGFRLRVGDASTEELRGLVMELVAGEQPRLFEDERDKRIPADELYRRSASFARALIVREELLQRGEEPPEQYLLALRRHMNALEISEDPNLGRYKAEKIFSPEQVAAFLAEDAADNERIRLEMEKLDANDMRALMLATPVLRRLSEAFRKGQDERGQAKPEAV